MPVVLSHHSITPVVAIRQAFLEFCDAVIEILSLVINISN